MARDRDREEHHRPEPPAPPQMTMEQAAQTLRGFTQLRLAFQHIDDLIGAALAAEATRVIHERELRKIHDETADAQKRRATAVAEAQKAEALAAEQKQKLAAIDKEMEQAAKGHAAQRVHLDAELQQRRAQHHDQLAAEDERHRQDMLALEAERDHILEEIKDARATMGEMRDRFASLAGR